MGIASLETRPNLRGHPTALVIGAGSTGAAIAHDLALRGVAVTLVERGEIASGTTGRNHGLLHSGARYAVKDPESAAECIAKRDILARIAQRGPRVERRHLRRRRRRRSRLSRAVPGGLRPGGHPDPGAVGARRSRDLEPALTARVLAAVEVPDGVFDPLHLCLAFLATARANGAKPSAFARSRTSSSGAARSRAPSSATGGRLRSPPDRGRRRRQRDGSVGRRRSPRSPASTSRSSRPPASWSPSPAALVDRVVNRLDKPSDGDIVLPQRQTVVIGTSSWPVEDPDCITIPRDHVALMFERGGELVPSVRGRTTRGVFAAARPLIGRPGGRDGRARPLTDVRMLRPRRRRNRRVRHDQRRQDDDGPGDGGGHGRRRLPPSSASRRRAGRGTSGCIPTGTTSMRDARLRLRLWRTARPGRARAGFDDVVVSADPAADSVLDVIERAWAEVDPTLVFRHACHHASCGTCAVRVNGRERLPCVTHLGEVWDGRSALTIEPLRNVPIVADLAVDPAASAGPARRAALPVCANGRGRRALRGQPRRPTRTSARPSGSRTASNAWRACQPARSRRARRSTWGPPSSRPRSASSRSRATTT